MENCFEKVQTVIGALPNNDTPFGVPVQVKEGRFQRFLN